MSGTDFLDLGYRGNKFTWRNNQSDKNHIRQRLDWVLVNHAWRASSPRAVVTHLPTIKSYHNPVLLKLWQTALSKPTPFGFEQAWVRDHRCKEVIQNSWNITIRGSTQYKFSQKL